MYSWKDAFNVFAIKSLIFSTTPCDCGCLTPPLINFIF